MSARGKSTTVRAFIHSLDPNLYLTAYVPNPNLTIQALFAYLLAAFHVSTTFHPRGLGERLQVTLAELAQQGRRPILVVDEAHQLSNRLLHELRFWLNADMDAATPFTLILLGQPDLQHRLQLKDFEALDQRIQIRYHLQPFDLEESVGYTSSTTCVSSGLNAAPSPTALSPPPTSSAMAFPASSTESASMACSSALPTGRRSWTKPMPSERSRNWVGQG